MLIFLNKISFLNVLKLIKLDIFNCRMDKIYCDINQCNASLQYLTNIPSQQEEYEVIYGTRWNTCTSFYFLCFRIKRLLILHELAISP